MDNAAAPPAVLRATRALALGATIALMVLGLAWELWLAPTGRGTLAIKVLPLALPLAGFWKMRLYTFRWVSLGVWLYFTEGAVRATSEPPPGAWLALAEVVLSLVLFAACAVHVRARLRAGAATVPAAVPR